VSGCWFGHDWTKWEQYTQVLTTFNRWTPQGHKHQETWQRRTCQRCGYKQDREVTGW
jgi:hypothetical protein